MSETFVKPPSQVSVCEHIKQALKTLVALKTTVQGKFPPVLVHKSTEDFIMLIFYAFFFFLVRTKTKTYIAAVVNALIIAF